MLLQRQHIVTHPQVAAKLATNKLEIHAWCYDIGSGDVRAYDEDQKRFLPVVEKYKDDAERLAREALDCGS